MAFGHRAGFSEPLRETVSNPDRALTTSRQRNELRPAVVAPGRTRDAIRPPIINGLADMVGSWQYHHHESERHSALCGHECDESKPPLLPRRVALMQAWIPRDCLVRNRTKCISP